MPPVLLAAFAMQESACNPRALGSGGTAGLLQLSPVSRASPLPFSTQPYHAFYGWDTKHLQDKCADANCYDPATNINLGAQYLKSLLANDSNILLAVGSWNGWYKGMTYADATAARDSNCYSQQNLD